MTLHAAGSKTVTDGKQDSSESVVETQDSAESVQTKVSTNSAKTKDSTDSVKTKVSTDSVKTTRGSEKLPGQGLDDCDSKSSDNSALIPRTGSEEKRMKDEVCERTGKQSREVDASFVPKDSGKFFLEESTGPERLESKSNEDNKKFEILDSKRSDMLETASIEKVTDMKDKNKRTELREKWQEERPQDEHARLLRDEQGEEKESLLEDRQSEEKTTDLLDDESRLSSEGGVQVIITKSDSGTSKESDVDLGSTVLAEKKTSPQPKDMKDRGGAGNANGVGTTKENDRMEKEGEKKEEEFQYPDDGVPYDRGWAWMIVLGSFINFVIAAGYNSATYIFFVKFLREFDAPVSKTALLFGVKQGINSIVGLFVMNAIVTRIGVRLTVFIGGFCMSLSAILGSFAQDLPSLILTQAVFHGLGLSMTGMSPTLLIGYFFRRRRSLANSISKCGVSVGSMVFPPLTTLFLQDYGLRGAMLLVGGVCLHNLVAAALMRPTSFYTKRKQQALAESHQCDAFHDIRTECRKLSETRQKAEIVVSQTNTEPSQHEVYPASKHLLGVPGDAKSDSSYYTARREPRVVPLSQSDHKAYASRAPSETDLAMLSHSSPDFFPQYRPPVQSPSRRRTNTVSEGEYIQPTVNRTKERVNRSILDVISASTLTVYLSRPTLNDDVIMLKPSDTLEPTAEEAGKKSSCCCRALRAVKRVFGVLDFSLFSSPMFRVMTVFFFTSPIVNSLVAFLPAMCEDRGLTEGQAAVLLSIIGGVDLCCRLAFGYIADLKILKVSTIIAISFLLLGAVCHVTRLLTTFPLMIGFAVVFGILAGVSPCLLPIMIMEDVGLEQTPQALGFCKLFSAASLAAGLPLLGYIRDRTGDYDITNHVTGVFTLASGVLLLCLRFFPHERRFPEETIIVSEECSPLTSPQKSLQSAGKSSLVKSASQKSA